MQPIAVRLFEMGWSAVECQKLTMVADRTTDAIYVLCFALLLLSVDLHNPHIKNKMSKREFVRNNRTIDTLDALDDDFLGMWSDLPPPDLPHPRQTLPLTIRLLWLSASTGQLYDNVYLFGHVAEPQERTPAQRLLDRSLG